MKKFVSAAVLLLATTFTVAQDKNAIPLPPAPKPSVDKAAKTPTDYSQEPFVIQELKSRVRFDNDGTGFREMTIRVLVNSAFGVQQWGQLVIGYSQDNEQVEVPYVRVIKPDKSVINAPLDNMQDMTAPVLRQAPMYTDFRQKHITVPSLAPGDILEYQMVTKVVKALAPNQFWFEYEFDHDNIILNEVLEIDVPRDRKIKLKTTSDYKAELQDQGDRTIYRWTSSNTVHKTPEEIKKERIKKYKERALYTPAIQLTTFQSWQEIGDWYAKLQKDRAEPTPEIRAKALELTKDKKTDEEKIRAIYNFVAPDFRYVSLSFGVGRYQPHAASEIFANKYGDCKDKHTLLEAMLASIGIEADPVLINSWRKLDEEVPSPSQFDHVISYVEPAKMKLWLDTTPEVAPFGLLSYQIRGKKALWVSLKGKPQIIETPPNSPVPNEQYADIDAKINDVGTLIEKVHYTARGDSELLFRSAFRNAPETNWKDMMGEFGGLHGEASDLVADKPADTSKPFEVRFTLTVQNYMAWSSKNPTFKIPVPRLSIPAVSDDDDSDDAVEDPITLNGAPFMGDFRIKLEVPEKYKISLPLPSSIKRDYGVYTVTYSQDKNIITAERRVDLHIREVSKARVDDYLAFRRVVDSDQEQLIALDTSNFNGPKLPENLKIDDLVAAGQAALQNHNEQAALEAFKRATELEPKNKYAWNGLGASYMGLQRNADAIAAFQKQLELNPYDSYANSGIGFAYAMDRKWPEAAAAFQKQLDVNPLDPTAHAALANALMEQRKFAEAVPELEKSASLQPRNGELQTQLGRAYLEVGQNDKGMAAFDKAVELSNSAEVWNNVAYELARHKVQLDRAQQYSESAVAEIAAQLRNVDPDHLKIEDYSRVAEISSYWDTLGWVHFAKGDMQSAEKYVGAAWQLNRYGECGDHLAQIYEKTGRADKAAQMYAMALQTKHSYPEAREHLTALLKDKKKVEAALKQADQELALLADINVGLVGPDKMQGNVALVFSPGPKVDAVKLLGSSGSGDDKLKDAVKKLSAANYGVSFPDDTPTKLVRRGTVSCKTTGCVLELTSPEMVTSAE